MLLAWYVTRKPVVLKLVNTAIGGVEAKLNDDINARVREGVEEAFGEALPKVRAKLDEFVSTAKAGIAKGEKALEMAVGVDKLTEAAEVAKAKVEAAASEGAEKVLQCVEESRAKLRFAPTLCSGLDEARTISHSLRTAAWWWQGVSRPDGGAHQEVGRDGEGDGRPLGGPRPDEVAVVIEAARCSASRRGARRARGVCRTYGLGKAHTTGGSD